LGERVDILRFTRQRLFPFRVRIHHYFRTGVGGNAAGKSDRQQTDHCDFKLSIHRETIPYLRTEEFSSPEGVRIHVARKQANEATHNNRQNYEEPVAWLPVK
jgi:hypothetical protein